MNNTENTNKAPHIPDLSGWFGGYELSECKYNPLFQTYHTPGVQELCEAAQCFWLVDAISSYRNHPLAKAQGHMQSWLLKKTGEHSADLMIVDCTTDKRIRMQQIPLTDFPFPPEGEFKLWVTDCWNGHRNCKMVILPQEY